MASARSSSFRSQPGYVTRPVISSAYPAPSMSIPAIPNVPKIDDARAPNAIGRNWIQTQLTNLPGKYNPALGLARDNARAQLAGYGGVTFKDDDPNTPEREDLQVSFDPNAKLGQREKNTVDNERNQANAAGMLESSFNDKNIGAALTRLNEEKRAIVNNFAGQINSVLTQQASEATNLVTDFTRLFGEDSRWLIDNPPPTPAPPPIVPVPEDPSTWGPRELAGAPPVRAMGYSDFLKGRKSTRALAMQWDREYNYGRRFGGT